MNFNSKWKCNWNDNDSNITENDIENIIDYINEQLSKNRTMKDIEVNDFGMNEKAIRKRLDRRGYKRIDGIYVKGCNSNKKPKKKVNSTSIANDIHKKDSESITNIIQVAPKDLNTGIMTDTDVIALKELVSLVEPIKAVIKEYNTRIAHDNVIDIEPIEIKLDDKIGVVGKAVGMRIDENIYKEWQEFTNKHKKNFKSHQLLIQALLEFMKKYK